MSTKSGQDVIQVQDEIAFDVTKRNNQKIIDDFSQIVPNTHLQEAIIRNDASLLLQKYV